MIPTGPRVRWPRPASASTRSTTGYCRSCMTAAMPGSVALLPAEGVDWRVMLDNGARVVAAAPFAGTSIDAWCVTMAPPEPSGDDITLTLTPDGTLRHIPGFDADTGDDIYLGGYPVPLQTG